MAFEVKKIEGGFVLKNQFFFVGHCNDEITTNGEVARVYHSETEVAEALARIENREKEVAYAYPTSDHAEMFGAKNGCWLLLVDFEPVASYPTKELAIEAGESIPGPWSWYTAHYHLEASQAG